MPPTVYGDEPRPYNIHTFRPRNGSIYTPASSQVSISDEAMLADVGPGIRGEMSLSVCRTTKRHNNDNRTIYRETGVELDVTVDRRSYWESKLVGKLCDVIVVSLLFFRSISYIDMVYILKFIFIFDSNIHWIHKNIK